MEKIIAGEPVIVAGVKHEAGTIFNVTVVQEPTAHLVKEIIADKNEVNITLHEGSPILARIRNSARTSV